MLVLVIDDHPLIHELIAAVVKKALGSVTLCSEHSIEAAMTRVASGTRPDLAILDLGLPGCDGAQAVTRFRQGLPEVPVVVFSARDDRDCILSAFRAGAAGYIPKTSNKKVMVAALRLVAEGGTYIPPEVIAEADTPTKASAGQSAGLRLELTGRQFEVLRLLLEGYSNQRIAKELAIAESTVKQHAKAVYDALGASTRAEMLVAAGRRNIKLD
jgi:DNA-binding NarL/FixJ family response regulator